MTPRLVRLTDRDQIEAFLRRDTRRHIFELGDLDERYWPHTQWYGWIIDGHIVQIALLYTRPAQPVLLFFGDAPLETARQFATALLSELPPSMYAHLGREVIELFEADFEVKRLGSCVQMHLVRPEALEGIETDSTIELSSADEGLLRAFYAAHYPETALDPVMLSTNRLRALRVDDEIVSIAALHVYSRPYHVAALGGVATSPAYRRRGLAKAVCVALCKALMDDGIHDISLDVMTYNTAAIALYEGLGFEQGLVFETVTLEKRSAIVRP